MKFLLLVPLAAVALSQNINLQDDWQFKPGILVASGSRTHSLTNNASLISLEGSRRVSLAKLDDGFSIYHALIVAPEATNCGSRSSLNDGPLSVETPFWRCTKDTQFEPLKITYDALRRTLTINPQAFDLSQGNLFVVRLSSDWQPSTTQLAVILVRSSEPKNILQAFKIALPNDEFILGLKPY